MGSPDLDKSTAVVAGSVATLTEDHDLVALEVMTRLEAIAANSAGVLMGELPAGAVLEANVVLAERAAMWVRAAA